MCDPTRTDNSSVSSQNVMILEQLGGNTGCQLLAATFFDEIGKQDVLAPFFKHISISAMRCHMVKLFRVLFGPDEEKPIKSDFYDYMLASHTRLFRDIGLNETHFDEVAGCLVRAMALLGLEEDLKSKIVALFVPLRVIFEYGAQVAAHEKSLTPEQVSMLPMASSKTIGVDDGIARTLPDPSFIDIPEWLPLFLGKNSKESAVRAWTCALINVYGVDGDKAIADTFMDMPYMNHHMYLVAFLQLAFQPVMAKNKHLIKIIKYPRGPQCPPLCCSLFVRMVSLFERVCEDMLLDSLLTRKTLQKLETFKAHFPCVRPTTVNGVDAPHKLRKVTQVQLSLPEGFNGSEAGAGKQDLRSSGSSNSSHINNKYIKKEKNRVSMHGSNAVGKTAGRMSSSSRGSKNKLNKSKSTNKHSADGSVSSVQTSTSSSNVSGSTNATSASTKRVWRKMFGWIKV